VAYADVARNAEPEWDGAARETGALARHVADPLVARLLADDRPPALARLAARLVELDALTADEDPQVAHGVVAFDGGGTSDDGALDRSARDGAVRDESGVARGDGVASGVADAIAWVDTARGLLVHRVGLVDGRVARWQIVAPTEWNFHPRGALATELPGMRARDEATLRRRVSLLAQTLDPCVRFDVEIGHA
jgi:hypothetical protein